MLFMEISHLQGQRIRQAKNQHGAGNKQSSAEDGGDMFLQNIS
jgi:hypothetical protein